jgi:hypothetical protein
MGGVTVCAKCNQQMKPLKNGVCVEEHASFGLYRIWMADAYECEQCGATVITGFAEYPLWDHFMGPAARPIDPIFASFGRGIEGRIGSRNE